MKNLTINTAMSRAFAKTGFHNSKPIAQKDSNRHMPLLKAIGAAVILAYAGLATAIPVNINQADAELIADALNGIGQKTAMKIVEYRDTNGLYTSADDLLNISGIGEKKLAKIKEDVKLK